MSALHSALPLLAASFFLGGCWYSSSVSGSKDGTAQMRRIDQANAGTTPQQAQALISGKTWRATGSLYGPAVHYSTSDGRDFAWFYEGRQVVAGEWKVESGPSGSSSAPMTKVCLRYPGEATHPISKAAGADRYCQPAGAVFERVGERVDGDPLGLASRSELPFVSRHKNPTISQLQALLPR